jgi:hypothetical protein
LRLQLHLTPGSGAVPTREVCVELSAEALDALIAQLDAAKGALDRVKAAL